VLVVEMQAKDACAGQPAAPGRPCTPQGLESGQGEKQKENLWEKVERLYAELGEIISIDEEKKELMRKLVARCEYLEERLREVKFYVEWAEELKKKWRGVLA
jgi:1-acyl-sn-glycerol-3-phosphate acyltransferase